jgi:hypothetical protein
MFGGLAYVGHRMSQANIFLEERVMIEAKRRINANQVLSGCCAHQLGGFDVVWGIWAPPGCAYDPVKACTLCQKPVHAPFRLIGEARCGVPCDSRREVLQQMVPRARKLKRVG